MDFASHVMPTARQTVDLNAFHHGGSADTESIARQGLDSGTDYEVTNVRPGASIGTFTGPQLELGLRDAAAALQRSGAVGDPFGPHPVKPRVRRGPRGRGL